MATKSITVCDCCGKDLSVSGIQQDTFGLRLSSMTIPCNDDQQTPAAIYPEIEKDAHFCGINCLYDWTEKRAKQQSGYDAFIEKYIKSID